MVAKEAEKEMIFLCALRFYFLTKLCEKLKMSQYPRSKCLNIQKHLIFQPNLLIHASRLSVRRAHIFRTLSLFDKSL